MGRLFSILLTIALVLSVFFACNDESKSKDAVIKADIEKALKDDPMAANVTVDVKDAVATLSGESMTDNCKEHCTMRVETVVGVKLVVNNCKVLHETEMTDNELNKHLYDLTKDLSTINSIKMEWFR
jgi:regulatory protein YycI of two-component signal transduction system YycFG